MPRAVSIPDPFVLYDTNNVIRYQETLGYQKTAGLTVRDPSINSAVKTLVLISSGQSLLANVSPTLYTPTNSSVIDNFNIYDGALYSVGGPLLGTTYSTTAPLGPGNVMARVADTLVTNAKFDRVILVPISVGNTNAASWGSGVHSNRATVAMARLAACGISPGMTGVTFACIFSDGHRDYADGTSQASFAASAGSFITNLQATGFNERIFVTQESASGQTSNGIRSAQAGLWDSVTIFSGGDVDSSTIATSDGTHPSDAGAATMATIIYNAMHASGAPF